MNIAWIRLPKHSHVVLLEDSDMRIEWFKRRAPGIVITKTTPEFERYILENPGVDFFFLDHDLGLLDENGQPGPAGDGYQAAKWLNETFGTNGRNIVIHSINSSGVARMRQALPKSICIPFGDFEVEVEK